MDRVKKIQIEWFLKLVNMDLREASFDEKFGWLIEMGGVFARLPHPDLASFDSTLLGDREIAKLGFSRKEQTLVHLQERLKQFLNDLFSRYKELQQSIVIHHKPSSSSQIIDIRSLGGIKVEAEIKLAVKTKPKLECLENDISWKAYWPGDMLESSPLEVVILPKGGDETFLLAFAECLNGIPLTAIGQCHECNRWFLRTGRKRFFCSDRCRARRGMKALRKRIKNEGGKAYESELEKGKKRAAASYEERVRVVRFRRRREED